MSISALDYLRHIRDEASFLNEATRNVPIETFLDDSVLKRACVRAIEVIGEAAKKVPDDFRARHPEVEWRKILHSQARTHLSPPLCRPPRGLSDHLRVDRGLLQPSPPPLFKRLPLAG